MLDSLDKLCKRSRGWVTRSGVDWAFVSIELADAPDDPPRFTGVVLIDGRQLGYLVGNQPREFRLPPGEHSVVVHLGLIARWTGDPGQKAVSAPITLEPGERLELDCGCDVPAGERWKRFYGRVRRRRLIGAALTYLAAGLGWLLGPGLRPPIVEALSGLGPSRIVEAMLNSPSRSRVFTAVCSFAESALLVGMPLGIWERKTIRRLRSEFGDPLRLVPRDPRGQVARQESAT